MWRALRSTVTHVVLATILSYWNHFKAGVSRDASAGVVEPVRAAHAKRTEFVHTRHVRFETVRSLYTALIIGTTLIGQTVAGIV